MAYDSDSTDPAAPETGPITQPIRADWREYDSPCTAIVETVAAATGRKPTDLPPLADYIDTDGLNALVSGQSAGTDESARVTFAYADLEVTVGSDGETEIRTDDPEQHQFSPTPRTDSEMNKQLQRLLIAASRNDISIRGGWEVRNGPELPDWDVHITRIAKPEDDSQDHS